MSGHMTKDGTLAGPRVLEHMVDVVLHLESQESGGFRVLRAAKNRFGSTDEVGVFLMNEHGLDDVSDPSRAISPHGTGPQLGAITTPVLEGSRALLLEVQALTNFSQLPAPRRVSNGVDHNRLLMLTAVASRRTGLEIAGHDVIVSVAGGFRATEPAADLAIILAIASCYRNALLAPAAAFGEVGLSAELRAVPQAQRRVNEAARLGLTRCILPSASISEVESPQGNEADWSRNCWSGHPRRPGGIKGRPGSCVCFRTDMTKKTPSYKGGSQGELESCSDAELLNLTASRPRPATLPRARG